jgi:ABC-2 type transport system ATP-binding protein
MIRFDKVAKTFKRARVLDGIDLDIGLGERVALIGSNGAGKTTLIRCLLGEYTHEGRVTVDGCEPRQERDRVLAEIGFVPQLPPPLKMPVGQLIGFAAGLCDTDPQGIIALARRLGLDIAPIMDRQFVRLSGGMKQKLLIAIALGRNARVLVMDEPAANLDPEARKIFFELLAERAESATMLISSHRLNEVSSLVNRVIELDLGRVVLDDRVADDVSLTGMLDCRISVNARAGLAGPPAEVRRPGDGLNGGAARSRPAAFPGMTSPRCADQQSQVTEIDPDGGRRFLAAGFALHLWPLRSPLRQSDRPEGMPIKWDRDTCVRCNMVISDRRFAAEMRGGPKNTVFKFDDIGCAMFWLRDKAKDYAWITAAETRLWVADVGSKGNEVTWLEARAASYLGNRTSPMGYNFGATAHPQPGSVDFQTMRVHILAKGK